MEQPDVFAALALDFIQQLPAQQRKTAAPFSGVLSEQIKLFQPEIEKLQGQIVSHASGDFVAVFRKPFSAVFCAISLHRMFAVLSQALPELERIQLRIGIHADSPSGHEPRAQQHLIDQAHALKELVPGGHIFVSPAVASTIDATFELKPAGRHKLTAAAEPLGIFELIPPPIKPLPTRRIDFLQLRLPLTAALALLIIGGTAYGYVGYTRLTESALALWSQIPLERVQRQLQSLLGFDQGLATPQSPPKEETLEGSDARPAQKELSPTPDRKAVMLLPTTEPEKDAVTTHPLHASSPLSPALAKQLLPVPRLEELERHKVTEPLSLETQASVIIAAGQPQTRKLTQGNSSHTAALSIPKPRPRPAQYSEPTLRQIKLSTVSTMMTRSAEGPVIILPEQVLEQNSRVSPVASSCESLRRAFDRGALVPSVDPGAYKRLLKCQQQKLYYNREKPQRLGTAIANRQRDAGGTTTSGDSGSSGNGASGGKSNGRGNSKGN